MEEKYAEVHAFLSAGSYPRQYDKSKRQNLRRYAAKFTLRDGELFFGTRQAVKSKEEARRLFAEFHSSPLGGHTGMLKTRSALSARFYWYGMSVDIDKWWVEDEKEKTVSSVAATTSRDLQPTPSGTSRDLKRLCHNPASPGGGNDPVGIAEVSLLEW
ncbi:hypothetical protein ACEWY4_017536 [Coilia grayii]|uniref:Integrase zinc-binding domain-containing protein n=1 Tax=Coilia grayii TaxID=363190 RepID=A0ABD1JH55_9TELE